MLSLPSVKSGEQVDLSYFQTSNDQASQAVLYSHACEKDITAPAMKMRSQE